MKYTIGQYVYTAKKINGWWDYSMMNHVPENSCGVVGGFVDGNNEIVYAVRFPKFPELGFVLIEESSLKLG